MDYAWLDTVLPDAVVVCDELQHITHFNAEAERLWGWSAEEVLGRDLSVLLPAHLAATHRAHVTTFAGAPGPRRMDRRRDVVAHHRAGHEFPCEVSIARRDGDLVAVVRPLTDARRVQRTLAEAEAVVTALFQGGDEGVVLLDERHRVRSFNAAAQRLAGGALVAGERFAGSLAEKIDALLAQAWAGQHVTEERRTQAPPRWFELAADPVRLPHGEVSGVLLRARDVTRLRGAEERLHHAQRMDTVGRLAAGVAHDFNNLLTPIAVAASLLRLGLGDNPLQREVFDIEEATASAGALTRQLLSYVRHQPTHVTVLDAAEVVTHFQRTLARTLRSDVRLRCELQPDALVELDRTQLEQVLMNLCINARDAMPSGGRLTLACGPGPDGTTRLAVSDTGAGMTADVRARLFEPFFTTKEPGRGTGLGLPTCQAIVTAARGRIDVTSAPGLGTTVELFFPRPDGAPVQCVAPQPEVAPAPPCVDRTLLVVDDDSLVRVLLARALTREGYKVLQASSAVEAIAAMTEQVSLVLTDVLMPEVSGVALVQTLRASRPGLPVLFFSGDHSPPADVREAAGTTSFLAKPFTTLELVRRVRSLIG